MVETKKGIGEVMKQYKSMIILLGVFVVLIGLYFGVGAISKYQAEKDTEEVYMLTELSGLTYMEYTDGETTMSFTNTDGTWTVTNDASITLDSTSVESIANTLCQLEAARVLEGADELSSYGLEEPAYTIKMVDESGNTTTVYIGDATEGNYYATFNDKIVVYVIDSTAVNTMEFDITALEAEEETTEETSEESDSDTTEETAE